MGNNLSTPETPFILTLPKELIVSIMSYLLEKHQFAFAKTCSEVSNGYKNERMPNMATLISNVWYFEVHHVAFCETFIRRMKKIIKKPKVFLEIKKLEKSQSDAKYSSTAWVMNDDLELPPDDETCASLETLQIKFTNYRNFRPDDSFWKKFPNLKTILLNRVSMNNEIMLMLSNFPLLESLFVYDCHFRSPDFLSTIFDYCAALKEFHMIVVSLMSIYLTIPRQLEVFDLKSKSSVYLNVEDSMNLQSFSVVCGRLAAITVKDQLVSLKKVKFVCSENLEIHGNSENLFTNVKELSINASGCYSVFGTFVNDSNEDNSNEDNSNEDNSNEYHLNEDSSNEDSSNEDNSYVDPKFTFGTYRLNFLILQHIKRVMIERYNDLDTIVCAFPLINERKITVQHIFVQKDGGYMEFKHNLSQGPIIVEYSPCNDSTETEYTPLKWGD